MLNLFKKIFNNRIPILWIECNIDNLKEKNSFTVKNHPCFAKDEYIITRIKEIIDYIRENYTKEDIL